jgi:hypothetical protein
VCVHCAWTNCVFCFDAQIYYNDVWRALIRNQGPTDWERVPVPGQPDPHRYHMPWEPRTGLAVALEPGTCPAYCLMCVRVLCT